MIIMKNTRTKAFKEMLFTYLAISKAIYWIDLVTGAQIDGADGFVAMVTPLFHRLVERDALLIAFIIVTYLIEQKLLLKFGKSNIQKHLVVHAAGFAVLMALYYAYVFILSLFAQVYIPQFIDFTLNMLVVYAVIAVFLEVKTWFKSKQYEKDNLASKNDKLSALKTLHDSGVLTSEEFESKKALVGET